jgi:hypothetical protein
MFWPGVWREQFPGNNGSGEAQDDSCVFKQINRDQGMVAGWEMTDSPLLDGRWPLNNPPKAQGKGETTSAGETCILPAGIVRFQRNQVCDRRCP